MKTLDYIIIVTMVVLLLLICVGCTPGQRSHCTVCEKTGLCRLLGDDPNLAKRPKYGLFDSRGWGDGNNIP